MWYPFLPWSCPAVRILPHSTLPPLPPPPPPSTPNALTAAGQSAGGGLGPYPISVAEAAKLSEDRGRGMLDEATGGGPDGATEAEGRGSTGGQQSEQALKGDKAQAELVLLNALQVCMG